MPCHHSLDEYLDAWLAAARASATIRRGRLLNDLICFDPASFWRAPKPRGRFHRNRPTSGISRHGRTETICVVNAAQLLDRITLEL
jgi:hypothetical protein